MKKHYLLIGSLLFSSMVFGAGYELNLQGMRQLAMGGSGAAVPWDVSTIYYNPAGLSSVRNFQAYGSINARMVQTRYAAAPTGEEIVDAAKQTFVPISAYIGSPIAYKSRLSLGFGVYNSFGTGVDWGDNWTGRFMVREMRLTTTFFQPTASYQITDDISFGAGFVYGVGNYEYRRALPYSDINGNEGSSELTGRATGVGYNLGLQIKASEDVTFGITYRSQVNMNINRGYARFTLPASIETSYINTAFRTTLPMPQVATVGMGWHVNKELSLTIDASYTGWSAYDTLRFDYENNTNLLKDETLPRRYRNTISVRGGLMYNPSDNFSIMVGGAFIPTPVREGFISAELPDSKRYLATAGLSVKLSKRLMAIGAVEYTFAENRTGHSTEFNFTGRYQTSIINPGLALIYDFN